MSEREEVNGRPWDVAAIDLRGHDLSSGWGGQRQSMRVIIFRNAGKVLTPMAEQQEGCSPVAPTPWDALGRHVSGSAPQSARQSPHFGL